MSPIFMFIILSKPWEWDENLSINSQYFEIFRNFDGTPNPKKIKRIIKNVSFVHVCEKIAQSEKLFKEGRSTYYKLNKRLHIIKITVHVEFQQPINNLDIIFLAGLYFHFDDMQAAQITFEKVSLSIFYCKQQENKI